jgi:altronate hydrolase
VLVGTAREAIRPSRLHTANIQHATNSYTSKLQPPRGLARPDVSACTARFRVSISRWPGGQHGQSLAGNSAGVLRKPQHPGAVGRPTGSGYGRRKSYQPETRQLPSLLQAGKSVKKF